MTYTSPTQYSNIVLNEISYQGNYIPTDSGVWSSKVVGLFNNNNTATFANLNLPTASGVPSNTSSLIDGGGGTNTVVYRANKSNYTVSKQIDGSYLVTSATTAEGPDTLMNIQILQFSDTTMNLN
jgi:hypothetical protein